MIWLAAYLPVFGIMQWLEAVHQLLLGACWAAPDVTSVQSMPQWTPGGNNSIPG